MCGIVGYYGPQNPKDVIMNGLKALEYRGYDSAGVSILDQGHFKRACERRASFPRSQISCTPKNSTDISASAHTRWATHGKPSERNAHPHCVGGVSLVHNGIIENYLELREELVAAGAILESETDSELVAHLLDRQLKKTPDLLKAVLRRCCRA